MFDAQEEKVLGALEGDDSSIHIQFIKLRQDSHLDLKLRLHQSIHLLKNLVLILLEILYFLFFLLQLFLLL